MELLRFVAALAFTTLASIIGAVVALDGFLFRGGKREGLIGITVLVLAAASTLVTSRNVRSEAKRIVRRLKGDDQ